VRFERGGAVGRTRANEDAPPERRKYERFQVDFPMCFKIGRNNYTGRTVDACDEGLMIECLLSSKAALAVFKTLKEKQNPSLKVEFTFEEGTFLRDVEVRHFRFDFSGDDPYQFRAGLWFPKKSETGFVRSE
jgi:hypothetical protein